MKLDDNIEKMKIWRSNKDGRALERQRNRELRIYMPQSPVKEIALRVSVL